MGRKPKRSILGDASTVDQVINTIKQSIARAELQPGERLVEPDLMAQFGISRQAVREALLRLTADGILVTERFHGASVARLSRQQVKDLGEIRSVLEGLAAGKAAEHKTMQSRADFARLESVHAKVAVSPRAYDEYNRKFHELIVQYGQNPEVESFVERTKLPVFRLQFASILLNPAHIKYSVAEHQKVIAAIMGGDSKGAERAMREHVQKSIQRILSRAPDHYFSDSSAENISELPSTMARRRRPRASTR